MPILPITLLSAAGPLEMRLDLDPALPTARHILDLAAAQRIYEPDVSNVMLRVLRPGDTVVDVGANIGFFTVMAARLVGPQGRVVAVEPDAVNLARLRANITLNGLDNVAIVESPLADRAGPVDFFINSDDNGGNALWDPAQFPGNDKSAAAPRRVSMTADTLDLVADRLGIGTPRLIKIDTEGAEHTILRGAARLLGPGGAAFVITELHEFGLQRMGSSQDGLRRLMAEHGYQTFVPFLNGALPKLIPTATRIRKQGLLNLLFATENHIARAWPEEIIHPKVWR